MGRFDVYDFRKCSTPDCKLASSCYRKSANDVPDQTHDPFEPREDLTCDGYVPDWGRVEGDPPDGSVMVVEGVSDWLDPDGDDRIRERYRRMIRRSSKLWVRVIHRDLFDSSVHPVVVGQLYAIATRRVIPDDGTARVEILFDVSSKVQDVVQCRQFCYGFVSAGGAEFLDQSSGNAKFSMGPLGVFEGPLVVVCALLCRSKGDLDDVNPRPPDLNVDKVVEHVRRVGEWTE